MVWDIPSTKQEKSATFSGPKGSLLTGINKNKMTGPASCKKTTRYHADLPLCEKSSKIQIKNFFQKSSSVTFLPLQSP